MKVAVTGASGFIGQKLIHAFSRRNWDVQAVLRGDFMLPDDHLRGLLEGCHVIINLAGAPIIKRWNPSYKKVLEDSRLRTTAKLRTAISLLEQKPEVFISSSAVGIYPEGGPYTESDRIFTPSFLADLCRNWENEALQADQFCRVVICRLGIVLDKHEGALPKMLPAFKAGLGGRIASGKQGFSWIHIDDLVEAFIFLAEHPECKGIFNLSAPETIDNQKFTKTLAAVIHRPSYFIVPTFVLKCIFGEAAVVLTEGQKVLPARLLEKGFRFRFPTIKSAMEHLLHS